MARLSTLARFEISGEILSEDTVALLTAKECKLPGAEMDEGDFAAAWDLLGEQWQSIRNEVADYDTERLRRRWIMHVVELLGYQPEFLRSHPSYAEGRTIPLTHRANSLPLWLLDYKVSPDEKLAAGKRRSSPHEQFQDYLDLTDDDWGIICSGKVIRLLHDYHKTLTRNYVEADLESIFDALDVDAFRAVWRIFRAEQFIPGAKGVRPIEKLREQSLQEGQEIGKELRKQVLDAIRVLGNGFLAADRDGSLRDALAADPGAPMRFYQALLRVVYRLLFLLYIENKPGWTPAADPVWASSYSISRLRERAEEQTSTDEGGGFRFARADAEDYWEGLKVVFGIIRDGTMLFKEPVHPYGGELFDDAGLWLLRDASLHNGDLLRAIRLLTFFENKKTKQSYRVNFRTIRIDALGSVYEALLDVAPVMNQDGTFGFGEGTERKLTGSYYTPPDLVAKLIKSALVPVIEDRLKDIETQDERETALLSIKVVDPACGSGAFLIQALDKLAEKLCDIRLAGEEPGELHIREARRDVVTHCIHGVDLNPMAVELCKFTLWLHVAHPKLPLSYLEPRIKCGNALVGVPLKKQVEEAKKCAQADQERIVRENGGRLHAMPKAAVKEYEAAAYIGWPDAVPTPAFDPITGDLKEVAKRVKARNEQEIEQKAQEEFEWLVIGRLADWFERVHQMPERSIDEVRAKADAYRDFIQGQAYEPAKTAADTWCAAFYWPLDGTDAHALEPTTARYHKIEKNPLAGDFSTLQVVRRLAQTVRFFHWDLEFPDVFHAGGFDCVLGNPPWERITLKEPEFFASRAPEIASATNQAIRRQMIQLLADSNPSLYSEFQLDKHSAEAESKFLRKSGRHPYTGRGDVNTYAVFAEVDYFLLGRGGRSGIIVPTALVTSDTTKEFFALLTSKQALRSIYDFLEARDFFVGLESRDPFSLVTLMKSDRNGAHVAKFVFGMLSLHEAYDTRRQVHIAPVDHRLFNPNTETCAIFRTRADAELCRHLYERVPVLWHEQTNINPWCLTFLRMFDMSNDSGKFLDAPSSERAALYEAKMFRTYDHRFGSYSRQDSIRGPVALPETTLTDYRNPSYQVTPFYWIARSEVDERLADKWTRSWLLAIRNNARNSDARSLIGTVIPRVGVGHSAHVLLPNALEGSRNALLVGNLSAMVTDYVLRGKLSGANVSYYILKQLVVLPPIAFSRDDESYIRCRVNELVYTAWDMKPFAEDMHYNGPPFTWDEDRRALLRAELDAYFARLYGLNRKQLRYILEPHGLSDRELEDILDPWEEPSCAGPHLLPDNPTQDFPGETFRVLKNNETAKYGEYRTRRLVLDAWARLEAELGPVNVVNYREMIEQESKSKPTPEQAVREERAEYRAERKEPEELVLVSPDAAHMKTAENDAPTNEGAVPE